MICPECNEELEFENGNPMSWDDPESLAVIFCPVCGYEREPTEEDIEELVQEEDEDDEEGDFSDVFQDEYDYFTGRQ